MKITKKRVLSVLVVLVIIAGVGFGIYLKQVSDYQRAVKEISIEELKVENIADGVYIGECNVNFIYAKVEVVVAKGRIVTINLLEHKHDRGQTAEKIVNDIVEAQRIDVDAISGATNSSTVIKKAVEKALQ